MDAVGEVNAEEPENCSVCCDASELTITSEEKAPAVALSETLIARFECPLTGSYLLEFARLERSNFKEFNSSICESLLSLY